MMESTLNVRVVSHHGAPTLFINGRPDTGLMLYHARADSAAEEIAQFAGVGIDLFTTDVGSLASLREDGTFDFEEMETKMRVILGANPRALIMPRILLYPPEWWKRRHPEEMMVHRDPFLGQEVKGEYSSVSFASDLWRCQGGSALRAVIRHFEERWHDHILGYHLCGGECGEWSYIWRHYTESDFSAAQTRAFQQWLERRYQGDPDAFRAAWGLEHFSEVRIPSDWRSSPDRNDVLDAPHDRPLREYLEFHSWVVADALVHAAGEARAEMRHLGVEKVIAAFYGYHFTPPGNPSAFTDSGHHALRQILESPDVDILCAPYSYEQRQAGGIYHSQLVAGSARLHGKLVYSEDDTVTHVVPPHPYRYHCPDLWTSQHVIRRNILGALRDGGTAWFMDWCGQNWYDDPQLLESFAELQRFALERLEWDQTSVAEVAVLVSSATSRRLRPLASSLVPWCLEAILPVHRMGLPVDCFLFEDLPLLPKDHYKLFIVLDLVDPDPVERDLVRHLESCGAVVLWTHPEEIGPAGVGERMTLPLESAALRDLARRAGAHIYSEDGDWIAAEKGWIAVHGAADRETRLQCRAGFAFESAPGVSLSGDGATASFRIKTGETRWFRLRHSAHPVG